MRDQIADIAADLFAGIVDRHAGAEVFHFPFEAQCDVALFARKAVDLDQFDQQILEPFLLDQAINLVVCESSRILPFARRALPRRGCI